MPKKKPKKAHARDEESGSPPAGTHARVGPQVVNARAPLLRKSVLPVAGLLTAAGGVLWLWRFERYQPYVGTAASALGAMSAAAAGLIEQTRWRWTLAVASGLFTAWVTWYTAADLTQRLDAAGHGSRVLAGRLAATTQDLRDYAANVSPENRSAMLTRAGSILRERFNESLKGWPFDFATSQDLIEFINASDRNNGHALYFSGEVDRKLKHPDRGHQNFTSYLEAEKRLVPESRQRGLNADACQTPKGYCVQRTAWIHHLIANDETEDGEKKKKLGRSLDAASTFTGAYEHACAAIELYSGFTDKDQLRPTVALQHQLEGELKRPCPSDAGAAHR